MPSQAPTCGQQALTAIAQSHVSLLLLHVRLCPLTAQQEAGRCGQHIHMPVMWVHGESINQLLLKGQGNCMKATQAATKQKRFMYCILCTYVLMALKTATGPETPSLTGV